MALFLLKKIIRNLLYNCANRKLVIATKHKKEEALKDLLVEALEVHCVVPKHFDTDALGSFSGEVKRELSPLDCARAKCRQAMSSTETSLAVASEGSFGPHPQMPWMAADEELLLFTDAENQIEVVAKMLSTETNYAQEAVDNLRSLYQFAEAHLFPSHALILKPAADIFEPIFKGIQTREALDRAFNLIKKTADAVWVETDMRAMYNPSRMNVIRKCGEKLIANIASECPCCHAPGFVAVDTMPGLPCSHCGMPTASVRKWLYRCPSCDHEEWKDNQKKEREDPQYCQFCNP